jgi:alcohol dehydrogenase (NADP+)
LSKSNVITYDARWPDGPKAYGGFAAYWRGDGHFAIPIPDAIPSAEAAPMLCGGVTTYSPLKDNGAGPSKRIGIVGIGGLGHFGLLWAKALGCDKVVAISRKSNKKADALKMDADAFITTDEDEGWLKATRTLSILSSAQSPDRICP